MDNFQSVINPEIWREIMSIFQKRYLKNGDLASRHEGVL
jgi:hypothetical protein